MNDKIQIEISKLYPKKKNQTKKIHQQFDCTQSAQSLHRYPHSKRNAAV